MRELEAQRPGAPPLEMLLAGGEPVVLRGLVRDWDLVRAAAEGPRRAMEHLLGFYDGRPLVYTYGDPSTRGRPFYREGYAELDCEPRRGRLDEVLAEIAAHLQTPEPPTWYVASIPVDAALPGFRAGNDLDFAETGGVPPTIWIGNRVTASCHYDAPRNIACCAVGRRRFTVFPPAQIGNLYPGPLDPTPGGQAVSLVDFDAPDFDRFPRFRDALRAGLTTVLEPGDAIYIPSMWWHHVEGLESFNVLVNYWWGSMPAHVPTPMHALYHAMWTIRDRPEEEKRAWREVFEYYVFGPAGRAGAHLPDAARGILAPLDEDRSRQLRAMLIGKLNR